MDVIGRPETCQPEPAGKDASPLSPSDASEVVQRVSWDEWVDEDEEEIRLIDWGEAFPVGDIRHNPSQPRSLRAPEFFFRGHVDHRADLWRTGCVVSAADIYPRDVPLTFQSDLLYDFCRISLCTSRGSEPYNLTDYFFRRRTAVRVGGQSARDIQDRR